jgi:hypothetical protein
MGSDWYYDRGFDELYEHYHDMPPATSLRNLTKSLVDRRFAKYFLRQLVHGGRDKTRFKFDMLRDRIEERGDVIAIERESVALVSPEEVGQDSDIRLSLFPYHLAQNGTMNNAAQHAIAEDRVGDPPLALDLSYLLTAFPSGGGTEKTGQAGDQQRLLGLAMQVFYDNAVISGSDLAGSLDPDLELRVALESESLTDLTSLWNSFGESFQPSVSYRVSPVLIDSRHEEEIDRVAERETGVSRTEPGSPALGGQPEPDDGPGKW